MTLCPVKMRTSVYYIIKDAKGNTYRFGDYIILPKNPSVSKLIL